MSTKEEVTSGQANMATESRGIASAAAGQVAEKGDKASHVARDAWGSAKETTEEAADFVSGKAHEAKESIKDNTDAIKRAMNSKSG
ncbi:hypothetical protein BHE74_00052898 [Ensete ventricosum]|nr:hypothetical protein BHE74_00052898 [Ensete ventricosum]RZS21785.1 hypothetical protein BHM03_00054472 [Ensete ventricosum]